MPKRYPAHYYDDQLVLRVPAALWLAMLFLVRDLALLAVTFVPRSGQAINVLRELVQPIDIAADLPALVVLVIALRRKPDSPGWMRRVWGARPTGCWTGARWGR